MAVRTLLLMPLLVGAQVQQQQGEFVASCPISADDCTGELMAALNRARTSTVIIPSYPRAVWPVTPLEMANASASNRRVIFQPGLTIEAKRGAFKGGADSLLMCKNIENVSFEGRGATFLMHRSDYANKSLYNRSESRMGLQIHGCRNVSVTGLNISSTGGDGIYISGNGGHLMLPNGSRVYVCQRNESRDITIQSVHCHNNYRQGLSVISVVNLTVKDSVFSGTNGTPPMCRYQ